MPRLDLYSLGTLELQVELKDAPLKIGRSATCGICLNDPKISREHAEIRPEGDGFALVNLSQFGTRLNAQLVEAKAQLAFGDRLYFGERFAIILQRDGVVADANTVSQGF